MIHRVGITLAHSDAATHIATFGRLAKVRASAGQRAASGRQVAGPCRQ